MIIPVLEYKGVIYRNFDTELQGHGIPVELIDSLVDKAKNQETIENRLYAYQTESDPLYMEWQYDQTLEKEQVWRDKVAEIKLRYPLPIES